MLGDTAGSANAGRYLCLEAGLQRVEGPNARAAPS